MLTNLTCKSQNPIQSYTKPETISVNPTCNKKFFASLLDRVETIILLHNDEVRKGHENRQTDKHIFRS